MRPFFVALLVFALYSCKDGKNSVAAAGDKSRDFYHLDTTAAPEKIFYPVFELSPQTTAFVVSFYQNSQKSILDSMFERTIRLENGAPTANCETYDTLGPYTLMRNADLETAMKKLYPDTFYVYGTKGKSRAIVRSVVFGLDDCRTNIFAFCLDKKFLTGIGHPLFCTDKNIDLLRGDNYGVEESAIAAYISKSPGDYTDSIAFKVSGNEGKFYFAYSDDFLWGKKSDESKCKFPARSIYLLDGKNGVHQYWAEGLDLFGVGCD